MRNREQRKIIEMLQSLREKQLKAAQIKSESFEEEDIYIFYNVINNYLDISRKIVTGLSCTEL